VCHLFWESRNFFDTADTYGLGANEVLLAEALQDTRGQVVVATKFGIVRQAGQYDRRIDNSPEYIRFACEDSLRRLGVECLDVYYAHRLNPEVSVEETVAVMADLVRAGKVRAIGLCEVSAETLRVAHAVHPISVVQSEYSLWSRDPELDLLPACRELGVSFVAYSPLGRGILTGAIDLNTEFDQNDFRKIAPRFQKENLQENLSLVDVVRQMAIEKECTPGQLSLAWLLVQGDDIIPIPGTKRLRYLEENVAAAKLSLTDDEHQRLSRALPVGAATGARYPEAGMKGLAKRA
jgi:aryl-alcohol dehydrogenase-like predicted oxidoreductase